MYTAALLTSTVLALVGARIYERCELARDLLQLGVRKEHIATWVCIAYHESRFDTAARNPSSGDHGLLQISEIYWCGAGKACGLPCSALRDDDISDDVECALSIYEEHTRIQGNGFLAWVVYPHYCKHNAKKYLADCNHSAKDSSFKFENRAGTSPRLHDSYPDINFTISNPVQSEFSYFQSDRSVPSFLSVVSLLRGKFEQDFERDYNKNRRVNWARLKIDNVDDLTLPDFNRRPNLNILSEPHTTRVSTTSTTTTEPEPQYKPVKPWRTIETNQFRSRKMKFTPQKESRNETANENSMVVTTPNFFTSTEPTTYNSVSTSNILYEADNLIPSKLCCPTVTQSSQATQKPENVFTTSKPAIYFTTQKPEILFTTRKSTISSTTKKITISSTTKKTPISSTTQKTPISLSTQQYHGGLNSPEQLPKKVSETTENRAKSFWDIFGYLTTPSPKWKLISSTSKPLETTTAKSYLSTQPNIKQITPSRISPAQVYNSIHLNSITTTQRPKEIFSTPPPIKQFSVTRPSALRTTKGWSVRQPQITQKYSTIQPYVSQHRTERPQAFAWRRGKSWSNDYQNVTDFSFKKPSSTHYNTTESPSPTAREYWSQDAFKPINSSTSTTITSSLISSTSTKSSVLSKERQEITERVVATTPATSKTTFSIFDIYLNPAKRQQVPNYKVLFSDSSASSF